MSKLNPLDDYSDLAEKALEELGEGVFTKPTILSAIHKNNTQYWWVRLRRGASQYGISLKEVEPLSGRWKIKADTGPNGTAGIIEESQDLYESWYKNLGDDVQILLASVEDAEQTMLRAVDRGYDPYKLLYLAAANGAPEESIEAMAGILGEVMEHVPLELSDRHNKIMGYLQAKNGE